ncbi:hypothetical protein [Halobacterium zhouii]|uniref:hypothetical protein n=1 Tax=Halobacterium zhouii TaxID=2902624 RepID=UPI001E2E0B1E|nr:hypothetical protein [Halobacterium zhouii]
MKRREFVAAAGASTALAGCASLPALSGSQDCERTEIVDTAELGRFGGFSMTASPETVAKGEEITIRMENATESDQITGNRHKFTIHEQADSGWQSVYATTEHMGWPDIAFEHEPREGFTWTVTASKPGFSSAPNNLNACATVTPGTYRFVYWGVSSNDENTSNEEAADGVGVEFTVAE